MSRPWILHAVNVGYGDAFCFQNEGSGSVGFAIDTGSGLAEEYPPSSPRLTLERYFQKKGIHHIDHLILTHIHEDHVGRLGELIRQVSVGAVYFPFEPEWIECSARALRAQQSLVLDGSARLFQRALLELGEGLELLKQRGVPLYRIRRGEQLNLGEWTLRTLAPEIGTLEAFAAKLQLLEQADAATSAALLNELDRESNQTSLVFLIEREGWKGLFAADQIPRYWTLSESEFFLLKNVTVFKIPHHAQKDALHEPIFDRLAPEWTLTTASSDRRYNSGNDAVFAWLNARAQEHGQPLRHLWPDRPDDFAFASHARGEAVQLKIQGGVCKLI